MATPARERGISRESIGWIKGGFICLGMCEAQVAGGAVPPRHVGYGLRGVEGWVPWPSLSVYLMSAFVK